MLSFEAILEHRFLEYLPVEAGETIASIFGHTCLIALQKQSDCELTDNAKEYSACFAEGRMRKAGPAPGSFRMGMILLGPTEAVTCQIRQETCSIWLHTLTFPRIVEEAVL